jgi:hypothetical protein
VWGSPRPTKVQSKVQSKKQLQWGRNEADKKRYNEYTPTTEKTTMLSLSQSASSRKNELRQAGMRAPQISRDLRHGMVS